MRRRFYTTDVFTDRIFTGNPLAVFPDGRGLSDEQMQRAAREFNLSETVFVVPAERAGSARRLRIFTPSVELPFAGHPTIGTALLLAALGEVPLSGEVTSIVLEEGVGDVPVEIQARGGVPEFAWLSVARLPEFGPPPPKRAAIAAALSLGTEALVAEDGAVQAVSCGMPYLFVPLRGCESLAHAHINLPQWETVLSSYWAPHVYAFTRDVPDRDADIRARMFAPAAGVPEDPATGSAAAALAGYLAARDRAATATLRWRIRQGVEMGRPSLLHVAADKQSGTIAGVRVGGGAVLVSDGTMEL
jgi:trans-2,3-dihydro-3-hydroxyanthranilate isomerase